jgi:hypothetical protein
MTVPYSVIIHNQVRKQTGRLDGYLKERNFMSIRPTDLQIIIQKAQEVERLQQAQQQQEKAQQQQFAEHLHKQDEVKKHQVNATKHADELEIHNKEKQSNKGSAHEKRREHSHEDDKDNEKENAKQSQDHMIDLTI